MEGVAAATAVRWGVRANSNRAAALLLGGGVGAVARVWEALGGTVSGPQKLGTSQVVKRGHLVFEVTSMGFRSGTWLAGDKVHVSELRAVLPAGDKVCGARDQEP